MKKIYFAGSIRGGREDAKLYQRIISHISTSNKVLTEHIGNPHIDSAEKGMTDQDILDWIGQEVSKAEWCSDMTFDDYDASLEVETNDGDRFEIIVKPLEGGSEDVMLESENVPTNVKVDLVELIETYAKEMVNKAKGDRTAGMAAKIAHDKLMDLISSL